MGDGDEIGLGEGEVQFLPIFAGRAELVPFVEVLRVSNLKSCLRFRVPHYLVKLEITLEQPNKVWLNRRVRVNPDRKFFPSKK